MRRLNWYSCVRLLYRIKDSLASITSHRHLWKTNRPLLVLLGGMVLLLALYTYLLLIIEEKYEERQKLMVAIRNMADASVLNNQRTLPMDEHKNGWSQTVGRAQQGAFTHQPTRDLSGLRHVNPISGRSDLAAKRSQTAVMEWQTPTCKPKQNVAFIKVHKAGSTTVQSVFLRYGYSHNLTVMLPGGKNPASFSWPNFPAPGDAYPVSGGVYNILTHHARYHPETIRARMPPDTARVAIMRHPLDHLKSMFNFIHLNTKYKLDPLNPIQMFLENVTDYAEIDSKFYDGRSPTRNFQSYVLGFDQRKDFGDEEVEQHFREIKTDVPFVMILEHLDESLIVLKRSMCWVMKDILYDWTARNYRRFYYKSSSLSQLAMENHRKWSSIDYALYEHYNRTLWEEVEKGGEDFASELEHFRTMNSNVNEHCRIDPKGRKSFSATRWSMAWTVDATFCKQLRQERFIWDWKLSMRQNEKIRREKLDT
ncbi:GAL3ST1 [Branchiostoma lanceolatum]|uniref:GAL3ST1 protein n=2 Tax=Branchiostoma lanceolatum TaxID=7740 RepID=A0A8K0EL10_BRALA|nr:GAL3ST1 [Branchiostoma lanceolatum]